MKIYPPKQLSKEAGEYYRKLLKQWPDLTGTQKDLCAIAAEEHESYWAATEELTRYAADYKTSTITTPSGLVVIHPAFKLQKQAFDNYTKVIKQIAGGGGQVVVDELDTLVETL